MTKSMLSNMNVDELAKQILGNKDPTFDYKTAAEILAAKTQILSFHYKQLEHDVQVLASNTNR